MKYTILSDSQYRIVAQSTERRRKRFRRSGLLPSVHYGRLAGLEIQLSTVTGMPSFGPGRYKCGPHHESSFV